MSIHYINHLMHRRNFLKDVDSWHLVWLLYQLFFSIYLYHHHHHHHLGQSKSTVIPFPNEGFKSYFLEALGHQDFKGYYMFQTPCINFHSFGNRLGFYFEAVLCAKRIGATYLATSLSNETYHTNDPFFKSLPIVSSKVSS